MGLKKTATIKLSVPEELKSKLLELATALELDLSQVVRSMLWERVEQILADINSDKEIDYILQVKAGREHLKRL